MREIEYNGSHFLLRQELKTNLSIWAQGSLNSWEIEEDFGNGAIVLAERPQHGPGMTVAH